MPSEDTPGIAEDLAGRLERQAPSCCSIPRIAMLKAAAHIRSTTAEIATLRERISGLFCAIEHGDDDHKRWLEAAIGAYFAGQHVPAVEGKGNKDDLRASLTASEAARLAAERDLAAAVEALRLAEPIVSSDLMNATEYADADWEGQSCTALEAIRAFLATKENPHAG